MTVDILEHRLSVMRHSIRGNNERGIKRVAKQHAVAQSRLYTEEGEPVYPDLNSRKVIQKYADVRAEMLIALKEGDARIVPDMSGGGRSNADSLCHLCGNYKGSSCTKPLPPYIASRSGRLKCK